MSTQGLTYPHDLILSRNASRLLQRVMIKTVESAKSLILLECRDCSESVQRARNQDRTSVWGRRGLVAHKVFHSRGGEGQKRFRIKNLGGEAEHRLNCGQRLRPVPRNDA